MKRTFEIRLPSKKSFLSIRCLYIVFALILSLGSFYWWKNIYPFFKLERAILCVSSMEVKSFEAGRLLQCFLNEGDFFQKGQILYSLDKSSSIDQLKELEQKINSYRKQIDQIKYKIERHMEQYVYLQKELNHEGKTSEVLDQILAEAQKMQGNCFQLEKEFSLLQSDRSHLEQSINHSSFVTDFDGVILRRFKQIGDLVAEKEPVYLISNPQNRWVEAKIPEKILLKIGIGSLASVEFPSFPQKKWTGKISWISPIAQNGELKIRITADDLPVYSGLTAKAFIKIH